MGSIVAQNLSRSEMQTLATKETVDQSKELDIIANKFLKSDSSFYLGWLYMGSFLFDRAADLKGYSQCIPYFLRAKQFIEKDYSAELYTRTTDYPTFYYNYNFQDHYNYLCYCLSNSYSIIGRPDSAYWIADEYKKFNFQKDISLYPGPYLSQAWILYRNRSKSIRDFGFLGYNLATNLKYINEHLDSCKSRLDKNILLNNIVLDYVNNEVDYIPYYNMMAIIHSYNKNYEAAEEAYNTMESLGQFPYNNYALLKMSEGQFEDSYNYFEYNSKEIPYEKTLEEWIYYMGLLNTYQANNKESVSKLIRWIDAVGSTPGYGWYQIALARSYTFDGKLDLAMASLSRARFFKEYHIGTTLNQDSYDQAIGFLDLYIRKLKRKAIEFEDKNWYWKPKNWFKKLKMSYRILIKKWVLLNKIADFPDREKLIYDLFSGESVNGWYELFGAVEDFSLYYFEDYYENLVQNDSTPSGLLPFYDYSLARIYRRQGSKDKAREILIGLENNTTIDQPFYKQLRFLIYSEMYELIKEYKTPETLRKMYASYSTLMPYTGHPISFNIEYSGHSDPFVQHVISRLESCNLKVNERPVSEDPNASIKFIKKDNDYFAEINLENKGLRMTDNIILQVESIDDGVKLAYALFNIYSTPEDNDESENLTAGR